MTISLIRRRAAPIRNALKAASIGLAVSLASAASADELRKELETCAQLQNPEVRLACYDALASISASRPPQKPSPPGEVPPPPGRPPAATESALGQAPKQESGPSLEQHAFGMLPGGGEVKEIESRVVGEVDGLSSGKRFELENGQVWRQVDPTRRNYRASNPKVVIKEGFMNSYRMRFEGLNTRIRVRRVK